MLSRRYFALKIQNHVKKDVSASGAKKKVDPELTLEITKIIIQFSAKVAHHPQQFHVI